MSEKDDSIVIVSGLPRSGTSMMMRMLEAGGVPALTDSLREADDDNPNGYYEFEPVKQVARDASWLGDARGKCVKMVYRLLYDLPASFTYKVLFMRRDLDEVLASQKAMLRRLGRAEAGPDDARVKELFLSELKAFDDWVRAQGHVELLEVSYNRVMTDSRACIGEIARFLDRPLDVEAMVQVCDPALYRQRR